MFSGRADGVVFEESEKWLVFDTILCNYVHALVDEQVIYVLSKQVWYLGMTQSI